MKIQIEIPNDWLDEEKLNSLKFVTRTCREEIHKILLEKLTEQALKELEMPKIEITREELKEAVLNRKVDEILNA